MVNKYNNRCGQITMELSKIKLSIRILMLVLKMYKLYTNNLGGIGGWVLFL